jgi:hypothetical protein
MEPILLPKLPHQPVNADFALFKVTYHLFTHWDQIETAGFSRAISSGTTS